MRRRAGRFGRGAGGRRAGRCSPPAAAGARGPLDHDDDRAPPVDDDDCGARPGAWSKPIHVASGCRPLRRVVPRGRLLPVRLDERADLPLFFDKVTRARAARALPLAPGGLVPLVRSADLLCCRPQPEPGRDLQRSVVAAARDHPAAQGITAIDCTGPTFCITIDGEGNSFAFDGSGWSGNLGAWGAANQISCASPTFCVAAEGGPSVWDGQHLDPARQRRHPGAAQRRVVRLAGVLRAGRQQRARPDLERPGLLRSRCPSPPSRRSTGTNASGLTRRLVPDADVLPGRRLHRPGVRLERDDVEPGTLIDNGHALTGISCPTPTYCVAVDRAGNAFVST